MIILPFIYTQSTSASGISIHKIQVFLSRGGTQLLSVDNPLEFCSENDIRIKKKVVHEDITYLEVDIDSNVFYSFHESGTEDLEVWRTYVLIGAPNLDPWNVNEIFPPLSGRPMSKLLAPVLRISA